MENQKSQRELDGRKIAEQLDQIKRIDDNWYQVKSQSLSHESWYDVISTKKGFVCDCPDHQWRKAKCKHIFAVEISLQLRKTISEQITIKEIRIQSCLFCKSENIKKDGLRHNKNYDIQRYKCQSCNKKFSINLGFERMKASPQVITSAMQLYFTGESLRNVQRFLELQGVKVTHKTVWNWIGKYVKLMDKYLSNFKPQVSDKWRADEMWLKINGNRKYLFAMMDDQTRWLIAQEVADTKFQHDAQSLLKMGKEATGKSPMVFTTDGLPAYNKAFMKEFSRRQSPRPKHIRHISIKGDKNNNLMERLNGEIRDREKTFRGLKKDDTPILKGYQLFHNYIRNHQNLDGQTPADRAGIKVEGTNKWITLIQNASKL
ncbi:MAG: IS6 family transposase [Nitrososphaerota archaeon]